MSPKNSRARYARIAVVSLLSLRFVGCNIEPNTPYGRGPQKNPQREMARLHYLVGTRYYNHDQAYMARIRIAELTAATRWYDHTPYATDYEDAVKSDPDRPEAILSFTRAFLAEQAKQGQGFQHARDAMIARRWLANLIDKNSGNGEYDVLSAQLARFTGTPDAGDKELSLARYLLPNDPRVEILLTQRAIDHGQTDTAIQCLFLARQHMPKSAQVHYLLGQICELRGDTTSAMHEYDKALAIDPKQPDALGEKALLLWADGKYPESDSVRRQLAKVSPSHPAIEFLKAIGLWNAGRYSMAMNSMTALARAYPSNKIYAVTSKELNDKYESTINSLVTGAAVLITGGIIAAALSNGNQSGSASDASGNDISSQADENTRIFQEMLLRDEEIDQQAAQHR